MKAFQSWAVERTGDNETLQNYINDLTEAVSINFPEWIRSTVLPYLQTMIGSISAGVAGFVNIIYNLLIGIIVSVYVLRNRNSSSQ